MNDVVDTDLTTLEQSLALDVVCAVTDCTALAQYAGRASCGHGCPWINTCAEHRRHLEVVEDHMAAQGERRRCRQHRVLLTFPFVEWRPL
ncbi:hypothetical protein [Cellulomonas palmilytica]|uniref:hypothetical protein n=1 Tax=Cellulomonas palmilytica TaxID=2608402 RepID=UPI001F1E5D5A|nr:hypothetical protein [Cellulomonas palmilytica]UJP39348.1 hypothetical protein F1D97_13535 [Cellulomonas palmilytica]